MPRLFVALRPPADVRAALLTTMAGIPGARWQADNQLHLTLAFLGELDRHEAQAAADALETVRTAPLQLRLTHPGSFDTARPGRTATLWIGVEDAPSPTRHPKPDPNRRPGLDPGPILKPPQPTNNCRPAPDARPRCPSSPAPAIPAPGSTLATLAKSIRQALRRANLPPDPRKFTPHITLARFGTHGAPREAIRPWLTHAAPTPLSWPAREFHLVESTLGHEGAHYTPLASYPVE